MTTKQEFPYIEASLEFRVPGTTFWVRVWVTTATLEGAFDRSVNIDWIQVAQIAVRTCGTAEEIIRVIAALPGVTAVQVLTDLGEMKIGGVVYTVEFERGEDPHG